MKKNHGFTFVEVLVAVVILATSLLGLIGMQTAGMKNTISSYNRTQATQLAYAMADRIRANRADAALGSTSTYITTTTFPTSPVTACSSSPGCTPAEMAANDLYEWNLELQDSTRGLPKTGTITYAAPVFTIIVSWGEGRDDDKDGVVDSDLSFQTDFQL